jgi:hypothetical protein
MSNLLLLILFWISFLGVKDPIAPSEPLFKQLGWMSIEQRIKYHKYLLVSKCLKKEAPVYLKNKIQYLSDRNLTLTDIFKHTL